VGAEPDVTRIPLAAGRFIRLEVMQTGIDLSVSFRDPSARVMMEADSGNGRYGPETLVAITEVAGEYTLEVKRSDSRGEPNDYAVTVTQLREATPADRETVAAHHNYADGEKLIGARTAEARSQAIERLVPAHDYFTQSGDPYMNGLAAFGLGVAFGQSGEFQKTLRWYEEAAASFRAAADRHMEAEALNSQGGALAVLGEPREALGFYQRALSLFSAVGDRAQEALVLNNAGLTQAQLSHWQAALDNYRQALPVIREAGDRRREGLVLNNMGVAYRELGQAEEALRLFEQALPLRRAAKDKAGEATTLDAMANTQLARGEPAKSLEYLNDALALRRAVGDRRGEADALIIEGRALAALGRSEEAERSLMQALDLARAVGERRNAGQALVYLAFGSLASREPAKAVDRGEQALREFRAIGDHRLEAISLETIARAEGARGNLSDARRRMEEALLVSESARQGTDSQQLRASFFATRQDGYSFYIDLLMRIGGQDALALETSERSRARSLLEMLTGSATEIRQGVDPNLLERERDLSDRLNAKGARLLPLLGRNNPAVGRNNPEAAELTQEIRDLESEYQDVQAAIRKSSPRYAALTQPSVLTASQIQADVLDDDTLLLEYSLGEERSYLWVVGKSTLKAFELPSRERIEEQVRKVSQLLAVRADAPLTAAAHELSEMVIGKAAPILGNQRLVIVPDGALQSLPFAMLPLPGTQEPLLVRHELVTLPSASALAVLRTQTSGRAPAPKMLAVFADPVFGSDDPRAGGSAGKTVIARATPADTSRILEHMLEEPGQQGTSTLKIPRLPYTAQEADQILNVAKSPSNLKAVGFQASRATAIGGQLSDYRYLHFATHGYLDTERPSLSALVLAQIDEKGQAEDGFLRVDDIYNARLSADLVVLSACQTGLGKEVRGEGLMGLTRAFLYAGVPRVVVSLWNVNDRATAELMAAFYRSMLRQGKRPSAALREAQLELRKQKRWESPYYWAAFVEHGEWR
jgi:CHAT domain-containing protein/Flp pilus assembly protein TadD